MLVPLCINVVLSVVGVGVVLRAIPVLSTMFIDAGLFGRDLCKADRTKKVWVTSLPLVKHFQTVIYYKVKTIIIPN